jgi:hypothetical protein
LAASFFIVSMSEPASLRDYFLLADLGATLPAPPAQG